MKRQPSKRFNALRRKYAAGARLTKRESELWRKAVADGRISPEVRLATYRPSWLVRVQEKLTKLDCPALQQRTGKWTLAKQLGLIMRLARDNDPDFPPACKASYSEKPSYSEIEKHVERLFLAKDLGRLNMLASLGLHLETAVLGRDTLFLREYREETERRNERDFLWRRVINFILAGHHNRNRRKAGYRAVEDMTRAELWGLVNGAFPELKSTDRPTFYRLLSDYPHRPT
jgi:hypothetical protein